jgi:hypothetical protein
MRLFRSRRAAEPPSAPEASAGQPAARATPQDAAIDGFWAWWDRARGSVSEAIAQGQPGSVVDELTRAVRSIEPRLAWELARGSAATHALVVTPEGDAEIRPIALRWLERAPAADAAWEYHASRPAGGRGVLEVDGRRFDDADWRAVTTWDESRELLDARLWHPTFDGSPEEVRIRAAFLFLDGLIGEDGVERWVGRLDVAGDPIGGRTPDELRAEVERRAASATGEGWVLAQRDDPPAVITANAALKRIDLPFADHHVAVTIDAGLRRLSGDQAAADRANEAQDRLSAALAGVAVDVGRVTEVGSRVIHYVTDDGARAKRIAEAWAAGERALKPRVTVERDPTWRFRSQLLG